MSETYTPTTEEVRKLFLIGGAGEELGIDFDRWLAEHDREKQAQAWEEGLKSGRALGLVRAEYTANPYRQGEN